MTQSILTTKGLTKEFRGFVAVNGVDLDVKEGTIHALIGPNGAGKTTCFNLLTKFLSPTRGTIEYKGRDITGMKPADVARRGLVRSFQISAVFAHLTALENVVLPSMIGGRKAEARARELLDKVGLSARLQHLPTELSGGEQQRVAIARALINDPGIIYADEPTGNLDASTGGGVIDMLMQVVDEAKKTLIVVTHDQTLAKRGDRRLILKEGRLEEG